MQEVSVIILAHGEEPLLADSIAAVLDSRDVDLELILVNNEARLPESVEADSRVRVLSPGSNTGFAGGCNLAADSATHENLVFVNSDLIVRSEAIARLTRRLENHEVGLSTGAVLLPGEPALVNSIGNPIHFLMFSWAGDFGEPFTEHNHEEQVAGICGGFFACRRDTWDRLGGFDNVYFAYAEDVDLSLRTWQSNLKVEFEPRAQGVHHYQFTKNNHKWYLLERNRLMNFFTIYDLRSTLLLLPMFFPVECGVLFAAWRGGWATEKIESWRWLWRNRSHLRERRSRVNRTKDPRSAQWTDVLSGEMNIPAEFGLRVPRVASWVLNRYWISVKPLVK